MHKLGSCRIRKPFPNGGIGPPSEQTLPTPHLDLPSTDGLIPLPSSLGLLGDRTPSTPGPSDKGPAGGRADGHLPSPGPLLTQSSCPVLPAPRAPSAAIPPGAGPPGAACPSHSGVKILSGCLSRVWGDSEPNFSDASTFTSPFQAPCPSSQSPIEEEAETQGGSDPCGGHTAGRA